MKKNSPKKQGNKQDIKPIHKRRIRTELLPEEVLLRVSEVAYWFNVGDRTIYNYIQHGHLVTVKTPGGQMMITKSSAEKWLCKIKKEN